MFLSPFFKKRKIQYYSQKDIEPHEILLDSLAKKKEEELGISEKRLEIPLSFNILRGLCFFFFFLILILYFRSFQFQILEHQKILALAEKNKYSFSKIEAERGVIYDRYGNQLVFNETIFNLILDKKKLPPNQKERKRFLEKLSFILNKNIEDLKREIENSKEDRVLVFENLPHQTLLVLEARKEEFPGLEIQKNFKREYKEGRVFSHLIGYMGKISKKELEKEPDLYTPFDYVGKDGLEKFYEKVLRTKPGRIQIERDALGRVVKEKIVSLPESGKSLVLWLDGALQKKIKEELEKKLKALHLEKAAGVALDPKTGGVLAMVSLPSFDNNLFQLAKTETLQKILKDPLDPLLNRVVAGQYLVGSTIKPLLASAALQEKIIDPDKKIYDPGFIEIPHRYNPEIIYRFEDWEVHGWVDLRKAIAVSCNVYFYTIGGGYKDQEGLGPTRIKKYLELFGWGNLLPIDLPVPEWARGLVPDPEWKKKRFSGTPEQYWWDGDTYNLSIGQGYVLATPLQVVTAFSAIANGGKLFEPHLVWKIIDKEKKVIKEIPPKLIRENFIDPENLKIVREGMRMAVTGEGAPHASAIALNDLPVPAAAKTGTAQVGRKQCPNCYNIWITVFAPYEDPQIVLTLMIEDVPGLLSQVITPVAKEILKWYFENKTTEEPLN